MTWIKDRTKIKSKKFRVASYLHGIIQSKDVAIAAIDADNLSIETFPLGLKPTFRMFPCIPVINSSNPWSSGKSSNKKFTTKIIN